MGKIKYNWTEVQQFYDNGHTIEETATKFGMLKQNLSKSKFFTARSSDEQHKMAVQTRKERGNLGHSELTKSKLSQVAFARGFGGKNYRKTFYYNGAVLESSYELEVAKQLDNNNVKWERPSRLYWTDDNGVRRHYTPDFYLPEYNVYLDPKNNYLITKDKRKILLCSQQNDVKIYILSKQELSWEAIQKFLRD